MNSTLKTIGLFGTLTVLLVFLGYFLGGWTLAIWFFIFSMIMNFVSYWFSDKIALSMSGSQEISEQQAPQLFQDVKELSQKMNIPMPKVYISNQMQPNAFATGRSPSHSAISLTQGITQVLNRDEIRGVIAHELGHIKNRDVLLATMAAVIAGGISMLAQAGLYSGGSRDEENRNSFFSLILVIVAPIAAFIIQMAISRQREYSADEASAIATGNPQGLANALIKIHQAATQIPMNVNPALSSLYIANPFKLSGINDLFSTHPSVESRVERLIRLRM